MKDQSVSAFYSAFQTNTFQLVLATDEVFTYVIFNYAEMQWTSHTEAGGDTTLGEGGVPAYVSKQRTQNFRQRVCHTFSTIIFVGWIQRWKQHPKLRIRAIFTTFHYTGSCGSRLGQRVPRTTYISYRRKHNVGHL